MYHRNLTSLSHPRPGRVTVDGDTIDQNLIREICQQMTGLTPRDLLALDSFESRQALEDIKNAIVQEMAERRLARNLGIEW